MALRQSSGATNKYGARRTPCGCGYFHQSLKEAHRCDELHLMQQGGLIRELVAHPQPRFHIVWPGKRKPICDYIGDFSYRDVRQGTVIVEDTKGVRTQLYLLKKKLMAACFGVDVYET